MSTHPHHNPHPHSHPELLFKDAMTRATESLPPLPDLVPEALRRGRRRRARARLAVAGSVFGVVTTVALSLSVLNPLSGPGPASGPAAPPAPVHVEPSPGEPFSRTLLPEDEQQRLTAFRQEAAEVLDGLLPDSVGSIRPLDNDVRFYRGEAGGRVYPVRFTVLTDPGGSLRACEDEPEKGMSCERVVLRDGTTAHAYRLPGNSLGALEISLRFRRGDSAVSLTVSPQESSRESAPVSLAQLVDAVDSERFDALVEYADDHPTTRNGTNHGG